MKYFVYARKSTEELERQALSIDTQIDKAKEMFGKLHIVDYLEESASAFEPNNRPVFEDMINRIENGEADGIIAWHPDRLSRNEIDAAKVTYYVRKGIIKDLKFGSYTFDNSPEGIMMLQMTMSQSQYSSAKLSKDVKRGFDKKISLGWWPGQAPVGYLNTPDKVKGKKIIIKDPERFEIVRKMWDLILTGNYSVSQILKLVNEVWEFTMPKNGKRGGGPISRSGLYSLFSNLFYTGYMRIRGQIEPAKHPAMITLTEFDRVQLLLGSKGRPRPKKHHFAFRGPLVCGECSSQITAESKNKYIKSTTETREYVYYHCTHKKPCSQGSITEIELEKQIDNYLKKITIIPKFRDWALKVLRGLNDTEIQSRSQIHKSQNRALEATQKKLDNLTQLRLKDLIDDEEYISEKKKLKEEIIRLRELIRDTEARADKWLELTEQTFEFATYARHNFATGDKQAKKEILAALGQNFIVKNKKLHFEPNKWFMPIEKRYPALKSQYDEVITKKINSPKVKKAKIAVINENWLRGLDSNQRPID